jgi:DtxR family Mn-dependent transcriptional regulator
MARNQSTEDYIKGIYKLQHHTASVTTSSLAKHLRIGDGSVTGMMKKLSAKKLIQYKPYKGVALTETGKQLALQMVRRHRLWEMFLVQFLGYSWDEIHDEAERLEHVTSDEMDRRLDKLLGYPRFDPHGDPIPTQHGELDGMTLTSLATFDEGDTVKILRVTDEANVLQHATKLGLRLNTKVTVKKKLKVDGSMALKIGTKEQFISRQVANAIFAERV